MSPTEIRTAWAEFRSLPFPRGCGGEDVDGVCLATTDTYLAGCISTFVERGSLDAQRASVVSSACADLERVLPRLPAFARPYFSSLLNLGLAVKSHGCAG
jgi:hypothetical protein